MFVWIPLTVWDVSTYTPGHYSPDAFIERDQTGPRWLGTWPAYVHERDELHSDGGPRVYGGTGWSHLASLLLPPTDRDW